MRSKHVRTRTILSAALVFAAIAAVAIVTPLFAHASTGAAVSPNYVGSGNGNQTNVTVFLTFYGFDDNSGTTENQHGSALIAYPKSDGNPTLHNLATEGAGTYTDPVTFAVRPDDQTTFPIGSVVYVPLVHKYFIMEDECGDTDPQGCLHGTHHVDLWLGPQSASDPTALGNCEDNSTPINTVLVVTNPNPSFPVDTTKMFQNNQCTIHLYDGNTVPGSGATPTPTPSGGSSCSSFTGTFHIINRNSGKYLDVQSDSTADKAGIVQFSNNGQSDQEWTIADAGGGFCKIVNVNSGKLLNIPGPTTTKGTQLIQYHDDGGSNSQWQLKAIGGGFYNIVSRYDGQFIDVKSDSTSNNAAVVQWTSNGQADQQWQIIAG